MSTFVERPIACPRCGVVTERTIATSINGPRIPEVVGDIFEGTFQVFTCPACRQEHEVDEVLAYVDFDAKRWVTMYPAAWEGSWRGYEAEADRNYTETMVTYAPPLVATLREGLWRRTVFGLEALREKLAIAVHGLDDAAVEALKLDLARTTAGLAFGPAERPRFVEADAETLRFRAVELVEGPDGQRLPRRAVLSVARARYGEALGDAWATTRARLSEGSYVDVGRLFFDGGDAAAVAAMLAEARAGVTDELRP